jgi:flagellar export protein FliJ
MLLKLRRQEEDLARRAFEQARGRAELLQGRLAELDRLLRAQDDAAREALLGRGGGRVPARYRQSVSGLRAAVGEQQALLRQVHEVLPKRRQRLREARSRRKAVELLREKLLRQQAARRRHAEAGHLGDSHAARAAARREAGK